MATPSQLQTLIELAERESDQAAKRLGAATRAVADGQQKLTMLHGYRDDYLQKLIARGNDGMSPLAYQNFMAFLQKLENAITGQQDVIKMAERKVDQERNSWQEAERKRMSYQTLQKRSNLQLMQKLAKQDQKAMDEHAARQAYYKR